MNEASTIIQSAAHEDANIIFGAVLDEKMKDEVKITVIATGFKDVSRRATHRSRWLTWCTTRVRPQPAFTRPTKCRPCASRNARSGRGRPNRSVRAERPRTIPYIPDNLDDIDSEIVRHAEPMDEAQMQARAARCRSRRAAHDRNREQQRQHQLRLG